MNGPDNGLDDLKLSAATRAVLSRARIDSLDELSIRTPADLCAIPSLGSTMVNEIVDALRAHGTRLDPNEPMPGAVDLDWDLNWAPDQRSATDPADREAIDGGQSSVQSGLP